MCFVCLFENVNSTNASLINSLRIATNRLISQIIDYMFWPLYSTAIIMW